MDTNNRRPSAAQSADPSAEAGDDWRTQLSPNSRRSFVIYLMKSLNRRFPFSGQEGQEELKKIALQFEEKICSDAMSPFDYLEKVVLTRIILDSTLQNTFPNSLPPNPSSNHNWPPDSGASHNMQPRNPTTQNISEVLQSSEVNSMGQGVPSNINNPQRRIPGRQQVALQQLKQQAHNFLQYLYQKLSDQKFVRQEAIYQQKVIMMQQLLAPQPNATNMQQSQLSRQQNQHTDLSSLSGFSTSQLNMMNWLQMLQQELIKQEMLQQQLIKQFNQQAKLEHSHQLNEPEMQQMLPQQQEHMVHSQQLNQHQMSQQQQFNRQAKQRVPAQMVHSQQLNQPEKQQQMTKQQMLQEQQEQMVHSQQLNQHQMQQQQMKQKMSQRQQFIWQEKQQLPRQMQPQMVHSQQLNRSEKQQQSMKQQMLQEQQEHMARSQRLNQHEKQQQQRKQQMSQRQQFNRQEKQQLPRQMQPQMVHSQQLNRSEKQQQLTKQQMLQEQQEQMVHSQQLNQPEKQQMLQQQQLRAQMQAHQMPQVHERDDVDEPDVFQRHISRGQHALYTHQQMKSGASFPISSPQSLQAASPHLSEHSSPKVDQQNPLSFFSTETPSRSGIANSLFHVLSPSTSLAPSPMPGDSEIKLYELFPPSNAKPD
ncbi:mediator of RNA polymerase II transcription subunit 15a-like isoform X1 [Euphorbia lathyris]|uniref:mediator of RNA polymerase II transcription subunit 15a-like isoform X1 n=1 Tax=Euphorbia lathyris TaxID=212925 RepID=UPI003313BDD0